VVEIPGRGIDPGPFLCYNGQMDDWHRVLLEVEVDAIDEEQANEQMRELAESIFLQPFVISVHGDVERTE
jgi:hypothetical protein